MDSKCFKQDLAKIYTRINMDLFGHGVERIKIDLTDREIIILAEHKRVHLLETLGSYGEEDLVHQVEIKLGCAFKKQLEAAFTEELSFEYQSIYRDYQEGKAITYILL